VWAVPVVYAIHVAEEAPGFADWARRHTSPHYADRDFVLINGAGFALTLGATALAARTDRRRVFLAWYALVLTQQAVFNPVFHAATTAAYREYSPGLMSSMVLFLPVWGAVTRLALRAGRLTRRDVAASAAVGGVVHAAAVAQQVFRV
jgi:hypothetical protein